jgi:acyl carrier protein
MLMQEAEIYDRLTDIFRDLFDDESIVLTAQTSAVDLDGWDSLNHINIVTATERQFRVKFRSSELEEMGSVGDIVALIRRNQGAY